MEIEEGCKVFSPPLEKYEMIWEKSLDTKSLLAWNKHTILLAFRGTASLSNVKADIQVSLHFWLTYCSTTSTLKGCQIQILTLWRRCEL